MHLVNSLSYVDLNQVRSGLKRIVGGCSLRHMTEVFTCIHTLGRLAERR